MSQDTKSTLLTLAATTLAQAKHYFNRAQARLLYFAETYSPASGTNWTNMGQTAPTAQDAALDALAAFGSAQAAGTQSVQLQKIHLTAAALVAAGTGVALGLGTAIPNKAIIKRVWADVTAGFTGDGDGSTTISLGFNTATDVKTAAAVSGAPWSTTGDKDFIEVDSAATRLKLSQTNQLTATMTINSTDTTLTAGACDIYVEWVQGS